MAERTVQRGRRQIRELLVEWVGYAEPTWEPATNLEETAALDAYEACTKEGDLAAYEGRGNVTG
jgi:hypothetical protein